MITGSNPEKYAFGYDPKVYLSGSQSAAIRSREEESFHPNEFGTIMQQFKASRYLGKRVRFSGFVKTEEAPDWCGLWMRIDDRSGNLLGFDNMADRCIKGTTDWNYYACVLDVPAEADCINIGILLTGAGHVWLDDCRFEEVGLDIPVTESSGRASELPAEPQNLAFEE